MNIKPIITLLTVATALSAHAIAAQTVDNLKSAFEGESTAFSKYAKFSKAARKEGRLYEANLFAAASKAEAIHASNHLKVLTAHGVSVKPSVYTGKVGSTAENVANALEGETYEKKTMYPQFIAAAKAAGDEDAVRTFSFAYQAEITHARLYGRAKAMEAQGKQIPKVIFYVCPTCGETFESKAPASCGVCATTRTRFVKVN